MKFIRLLVGVVTFSWLLAACSPSDGDQVSPDANPSTSATPPMTVKVGTPIPPLPAEINSIPYKPGDLVALGNAQITITTPTQDGDRFSFDLTITSGSLNPFTITRDMFRVYTVDGVSYLPENEGSTMAFGDTTLDPGSSITGTIVVTLVGDSEPAMFVADLSSSGERIMPGAWVFDPGFTPPTPD